MYFVVGIASFERIKMVRFLDIIVRNNRNRSDRKGETIIYFGTKPQTNQVRYGRLSVALRGMWSIDSTDTEISTPCSIWWEIRNEKIVHFLDNFVQNNRNLHDR